MRTIRPSARARAKASAFRSAHASCPATGALAPPARACAAGADARTHEADAARQKKSAGDHLMARSLRVARSLRAPCPEGFAIRPRLAHPPPVDHPDSSARCAVLDRAPHAVSVPADLERDRAREAHPHVSRER